MHCFLALFAKEVYTAGIVLIDIEEERLVSGISLIEGMVNLCERIVVFVR